MKTGALIKENVQFHLCDQSMYTKLFVTIN